MVSKKKRRSSLVKSDPRIFCRIRGVWDGDVVWGKHHLGGYTFGEVLNLLLHVSQGCARVPSGNEHTGVGWHID
eukprot:13199307-Ditylum_brightwellii.AAC.1